MAIQQECAHRIHQLQTKLEKQDVDGALFAYPIDIYYFTGTRQNALLWIPTTGEPLLVVRKSFSRARAESAVADVRPFPPSRELSSLLGTARRVGLTFDVLPIQQLHFFNKVLPQIEFVDISAVNRELRSVKSAWEIEKMEQSAARLCAVFAQIPEFLRPGMRELDLSAEIEYRARKQGCEGYVRMRAFSQELFCGIAISGAAGAQSGFFDGPATGSGLSSAAAHGASTALIARDEPILVDYTGVFEGYIVDMTRMFVFGALRPELQKAFDVSLEIQDYLAENLRPGQDCAELFAGSVALAEAAGLGSHFMGAPGEQAKFVGHGVGLELDELPILAQGFQVPLQLGQTVAIEPKFNFPGKGVIGIENTFAVGPKGGTRLTHLADDLLRI
ncbi:M24 family metallopeptidase [Geoalkalibacter halelectricus]|uniref:Xaa-Pro peptidase family protein n=1 Tax=Geoalkalibacter halelectricus TaxID=2847045 RepID=A0ABY5ZJY7_9BACT|nr:Xaa-Pro peptidase family protein [Geoalkalibacter halelectricus]MDO3380303.1 Xaa-Pro peptidase family protein [Geoalkalibacter halelectricus]UWZ79455.1 Xaa-Pro peptidase family protein [Geoalkalibacter halelectricus]